MAYQTPNAPNRAGLSAYTSWGIFWLFVAVVGAAVFFSNGINALLVAWQLPEYSHGPIIPVLSGVLFLRQLKDVPIDTGEKRNRWPGVVLVAVSLLLAAVGILANIDDIVAYALILWIGGILLISWGWDDGKHFWPGVVHLVYMLPLPDTIYYKVTTSLQFISSELGVWILKLLAVPVFLDGNIIDLGVTKLHVAEACSGLRYMFPIMSFSYIFACLYKGPNWQKLVLLLSAVPIALVMNSLRIAVAGIVVQHYGDAWLEGFTHFFEGWVIFLICIVILFGLAWLMLLIHPDRPTLSDALDLDMSDMMPQLARLQYTRASRAMITGSLMTVLAVGALQLVPDRNAVKPTRDTFALFPRTLDEWRQAGPREYLDVRVEEVLGADDYIQANFTREGAEAPVGFFAAWYYDQTNGGVHSPEVCLPGAGWEIASLERTDIAQIVDATEPFNINRAIIQKGEARMMVYYWFQQGDRRIAFDLAAKFYLMLDGVQSGKTDGALVRLTTPILAGESDDIAEARLLDIVQSVDGFLPRFIPSR